MSLTAKTSLTKSLPFPLLAVTMYSADGVMAVGVPVISPFVALNVRPSGKALAIEALRISPPSVDRVLGVIF
ncbi:MAG: hypothetical protein A3K03_12855 [Bdellovibrionales bacterium RIFOXYD1_FULL_44_7]|nr:MAG: hypothetical protein A3K03_12855 [Bdellovibrionales bacterium RIFOXYD1_FULL_44_7]